MVEIICFANSLKRGGRCIAGINSSTGEWVRPISRLDDGRIPSNLSTVDGEPIQPLDIIDIPLFDQGKGYECENRFISSKIWRRLGKAEPEDIAQYCEEEILHSDYDDWLNAVPYSYLMDLPFKQRRTLQLVEAQDFRVWCNSYGKWKGAIPLATKENLVANVTDPALCTKLNNGYSLSAQCLIALSLSQPWKKPDSEDESLCYRLIAGVIEL